jgi:hypothetical protein
MLVGGRIRFDGTVATPKTALLAPESLGLKLTRAPKSQILSAYYSLLHTTTSVQQFLIGNTEMLSCRQGLARASAT